MKKRILPFILGASIIAFVSCDGFDLSSLTDPTGDSETTQEEAKDVLSDHAFVSELFDKAAISGLLAMQDVKADLIPDTAGLEIPDEQEEPGAPRSAEIDSTKPDYTIDIDSSKTYLITIDIDFSDGITDEDGNVRKGMLKMEATGWKEEANSISITTFYDFYQNDNKIEGTIISTNLRDTISTKDSTNLEVKNGIITKANGEVLLYNENTIRTLIAGFETEDLMDNIYSIIGEQSGQRDTTDYSINIDNYNPLIFNVDSGAITGGIAFVSVGDLEGITLNYDELTITVNGVTLPIDTEGSAQEEGEGDEQGEEGEQEEESPEDQQGEENPS